MVMFWGLPGRARTFMTEGKRSIRKESPNAATDFFN